MTIYSSVFVHPYLLGCTSNGMIYVWTVDGQHRERTDVVEVGRKRVFDEIRDGHKPLLW